MSVREEGSWAVVIIGGGIAGASLAYFLARRGVTRVLVLERESHLAVHSTGRSAATVNQWDDDPTRMDLKIRSAPFFHRPPEGFSAAPLISPCGVLTLFGTQRWEQVLEERPLLRERGLPFVEQTPDAAAAMVPVLETAGLGGGLLVERDGRIDVHEVLGSYVRHARSAGAELRLESEVLGVDTAAGRVSGVQTEGGLIRADLVVNAAGAWAGHVARLADASPIPLVPHRRTLVTFAPAVADFADWPLVVSDPEQIYFVPEAGELMLSPMDQDPMDPCDPQPDDTVIASGLDRLSRRAPALVPKSLRRRWSGLRTFAPDGVHVVGEDPKRAGLFWLAGQGGCGIETSPAVGRIAADLIARGDTDVYEAARLAPGRFAPASGKSDGK